MWLIAQSTEAVKAVAEVVRDAQQQADLPWYVRMIEDYGFTGAFTVVVAIATWRIAVWIRGILEKYLPRVIEAFISHLNNVNSGLAAIVTAVDQSSEAQTKHGKELSSGVDQTNQSLLFFARAAKEACEHLPDDKRKRVVTHLDEIERVMRKP